MTLTAIDRPPNAMSDAPRSTPAVHRFEMVFGRATEPGEAMTETDLRRPAEVRRTARELLRSWGLSVYVERAELVLAELVTNALTHGAGAVSVRISHEDGDLVRISVGTESGSLGLFEALASPSGDELDEHGRGMLLVWACADTWGVSADTRRVWCNLRADSAWGR